uniref:SAM_MT_ERG6_SMT domain-containing protein n=1 Tax=Rhabditophanes sp. KR3021 TaxID=114890 RepID=A0AC35UBB9_9BILA
MSGVIDQYFNGNFHFVSPQNTDVSLEEALNELHVRIGETLQLDEKKNCVDIGCGIGGVIRDIASTGAHITGVTIAPNEVEMGNEELKKRNLYPRCQLIESDCHHMPFQDESFDCAYAIYALKYFVDLKPALNEISRVLKKGGRFVCYDLLTTDLYDVTNPLHQEQIEGLEYACGMPSLHSRREMIQIGKDCGLDLVDSIDLAEERQQPFHYCFSSSKTFMWLTSSPIIRSLIKVGEVLRILPKGFNQFNQIFLSGTVNKIVKGGELGILRGGEILSFRKI